MKTLWKTKYLEESKKVKEEEKGLQAEGKEARNQSNGDLKSNVHYI